MPIPTTVNDLSTVAASNSPAGSDSPTDGDNYLRALSAIIRQEHDAFSGSASGTAGQGAGAVFYNTAATYATATVGAWLNDYADTTSASKGAGRIGAVLSLAYAANTIGYWVRQTLWLQSSGAVCDGSTNDATAVQAAIDALSASGGGILRGLRGRTTRCNSPIVLKDGVIWDMEDGFLDSRLSGTNDVGVQIVGQGAKIARGRVAVTSSGSPGSQAGIHAPILVGELSGSAGTVTAPAEGESCSGWSVQDMYLTTDCDGKVLIQINGNVSNGLIENIETGDSSTLFGLVHADWNYQGSISSADVPTSRTNFDAGTALTTHPHNIIVRNVKAGALTRTNSGTDTGAHLVRCSAGYNITFENVTASQCTYAAVRFTAGDLGAEFAPAAIKHLVNQNVVFRDIAVQDCNNGWGINADSYADNVEAAVGGGYSPLIPTITYTNVRFERIVCKSDAGSSVIDGLRVNFLRGGVFVDCDMSGFKRGALIDEKVYSTKFLRLKTTYNREHGIYIHHGTNKPEDVIFEDPVSYQNGVDSGFSNPAGLQLDGSRRTKVIRGEYGNPSGTETTQVRGVRVDSNSVSPDLGFGGHVHAVKSGGVGVSLLSGTEYGILWRFKGWSFGSGVTDHVSGVNILPVEQYETSADVAFADFIAQAASLSGSTTPSAGTWRLGDTIYLYDTGTGGQPITKCVSAGSPGTWERLGATS